MEALLGQKIKMTQIFEPDGRSIPVTKILLGPCTITQRKELDRDGYTSIQLGFGRSPRNNKAMRGHFQKSGVEPRFLREVRIDPDKDHDYQVGDSLTVSQVFKVGDRVTVVGTSKGKGFSGAIKRWGFSTQPKTHGQGTWHRAPGSIGAQGVGKVFKGKKMAGRMGGRRVTTKGLEIVEINEQENTVKVKGAVPGTRGSLLMVKKQL